MRATTSCVSNHGMFAAASFIGRRPVDVVSSPARRTRAGEHLYTTRMALHAETSDLSVVAAELRATLDTLGVTQRRAARLFNVSPRHIRRGHHGDRTVPHTVGLVVNLLAAGVITVSQAEAAAPAPPKVSRPPCRRQSSPPWRAPRAPSPA